MLITLSFLACRGSADPTDTDRPDPTKPDPDPEAPLCAPVFTESGGPWVEGDTVTLAGACQTGIDTDDLTIAILTGPDGLVIDPVSWTVTFPTDLADAGKHDVTFVVEQPGRTETATIGLYVNDAGPGVDGNTPPDPAVYDKEFGVPVLFCDTSGALDVTYSSVDCAFEHISYAGVEMKIEADTLAYPKPSYTVRFGDPPLDGDPIGMGNKETLVLMTTFDDNSYVRRKLVYDLWEEIDDFWTEDEPKTPPDDGWIRATPDTHFVVLYLDGEYFGLYVAIDPIDDEFLDEHTYNTQGNLYRATSPDANFLRTTAAGLPKLDLTLGWEKVDGPSGEADLEDLTAFVADADPQTFFADANAWMRQDEFYDWYLVAMFAAARDSVAQHAWLYNDPVNVEFRYIPGFTNHLFGQDANTERVPNDDFGLFTDENGIFAQLHAPGSIPSTTVWARYAAMAAPDEPLSTEELLAQLDEYYDEIDLCARRDEEVWGDAYRTFPAWSSRTDLNDYDAEKAALYLWIEGRPAAIEAQRP